MSNIFMVIYYIIRLGQVPERKRRQLQSSPLARSRRRSVNVIFNSRDHVLFLRNHYNMYVPPPPPILFSSPIDRFAHDDDNNMVKIGGCKSNIYIYGCTQLIIFGGPGARCSPRGFLGQISDRFITPFPSD